MERTQLVSMRLNRELLQKIEKFIHDRPYWSRTLLVNRLLTSLFNNVAEDVVSDIMLNYDPDVDEILITAQIDNR